VHSLTELVRERLRVYLITQIVTFLEKQLSIELTYAIVEETLSSELRRLIARLHRRLLYGKVFRRYFVVYTSRGLKEVKLIRLEVDNLAKLSELVNKHKPSWAAHSKTYPIADELIDDVNFPFQCFWPKVGVDLDDKNI